MILWRRPAERHRHRPRWRTARPAEVERLIVDVDPAGVARLSGQLHEEDAGVFRRAMTSATVRPLRIDLGGVTSADAAGVQLLVSLRQDERRRGHPVELLDVPPSLAQVLCIAEVAEEFAALAAGFAVDHPGGSTVGVRRSVAGRPG